MRPFLAPFTTPLAYEARERVVLEGSGSFVNISGQSYLITCRHVAERPDFNMFLLNNQLPLQLSGAWENQSDGLDVSIHPISIPKTVVHNSASINVSHFSDAFSPVEHETFVFRGISGENTQYGFGTFQYGITTFGGQLVPGLTSEKFFGVGWRPAHLSYTLGTDEESKFQVLANNPQGFSGSLVWNTRFLEKKQSGQTWHPHDAKVFGIAMRYDEAAGAVNCIRIDQFHKWLFDR